MLLEYKADVNAKMWGRTALEEAAADCAYFEQSPRAAAQSEKSRAITQMLLRAGAAYDLRSACSLGDIARVQALIADKKQARDKNCHVTVGSDLRPRADSETIVGEWC